MKGKKSFSSFKIKKEVTPEELISFINKITKIQPIDFSGILKIFCISFLEDDKDKKVRNIDEVLSELIDKYIQLNKHQRKDIMAILDGVIEENEKNGDDINGSIEKD